jgi:DNA repair protein RadD
VPSDKQLRPYQEHAVERLRDGIRKRVMRQVLQVPTGGGKTLIAATMTKSAMDKGRRVMFLCDRIELIEQASGRFDAEGIRHGVIQGNHWRWQPHQPVQIATIQTLVNRQFDMPDLIFVDECHGGGKRLNEFIQSLEGVVVIGLSATPFTRGMGLVWDGLVTVTSTQQLIDEGYLVPPIVYAPTDPDLTGVKVVAGEWDDNSLANAVDQPDIVGDIVQTWLTRGEDRQTICFAVNVAHSQHIVAQFVAAGVNAEHIDGYTNQKDREMIIARFRRGDTKLLSNVGILDRGFDVPEAACIIYARPIRTSLSLYIQMGGRGLRISPGKKDCIILDHSGNTIRHGFLTDPLPEQLDMGKPLKKTPPKPKLVEPKKCPKCFFVRPCGVSVCPQCGFAASVPNEVFAEAGDLQRLMKTEDKAHLFAEIRYIQQQRGYSDGWASHSFKKMTGVWPNHYRDVHPIPPSEYTERRIKAMLIRYAKAKEEESKRAA